MPLHEMSPNRQEVDGGNRKRSHDEFNLDGIPVEGAPVFVKDEPDGTINPPNPIIMSLPDLPTQSPPPQSSPASLTDGLSSTPARNSPSPNPTPTRVPPTPSAVAASTQQSLPTSVQAMLTQQAAKRRKLTAAERAAKAEEEAQKKKEREEQKKEREDLKRQKLAEKAKQEQEREMARAAKKAEKAKREAEEQEAKAEKRQKKEDEERKAQEEKERKERSQLRLNMFFKAPAKSATTSSKPAPAVVSTAAPDEVPVQPSLAADGSPLPKTRSQYERMFQPFFVKESVHLAVNRIELDQETKATKAKILDEYVSGERGEVEVHPFNPVEVFHLISRSRRRGMLHPPVRKVVEEIQKSTDSTARQTLKIIPMKLLCFKQDVRPPYFGTITCHQHQVGEVRMKRVARRPYERVLDLQYDYDSEAEWQDDEPGEDLDDMDDDDSEDGDDDMDGFLDDSDESGTGVARRLFAGGEPDSSGICFENHQRQGPVPKMHSMRMEFIHGKLDRHSSIDPFSKQYWEPEVKKKLPHGQTKLTTMAPPPAPTNNGGAHGGPGGPGVAQFTQPQHVDDFKRLVTTNKALTKMGVMDILFMHFREKGLSRDQVKKMLDSGAYRTGKKNGEWRIRYGL